MLIRILIVSVFTLLSISCSAFSQIQPISGTQFEKLYRAQDIIWQGQLEKIFPESEGYFVTGPMDPFLEGSENLENLYHTVRVVCRDVEAYKAAQGRLTKANLSKQLDISILSETSGFVQKGYMFLLVYLEDINKYVQINTFNQTRYLVWRKRVQYLGWDTLSLDRRTAFAQDVLNYFGELDLGSPKVKFPVAEDYGLPTEFNIYPDTAKIGTGELNELESILDDNREIKLDYIEGVQAFIPTKTTMKLLKQAAPREAFEDKAEGNFQVKMLVYLEKGDKFEDIRTLTKTVFDGLPEDEYQFAVGVTGKIRFLNKPGFEDDIHTLLFPGEWVLTAGTFVVEKNKSPRITKVTSRAINYFYGQSLSDIKKNEAENSDFYFTTIGHFFKALDKLGIPYDGVLLSKF